MVTHATHLAVTPEERQHFDREGYVVLRDLLARAEVQELLDTIDPIVNPS